MKSFNIFKEVIEELKNKLSEEQINAISDIYDSLEKEIKFSKLEIMAIPNLEDFVFPTTVAGFKQLLNNVKDYATKVRNKKIISKIDAILQELPKDEATAAVQTDYYNTLQESYDSLPQGNTNTIRRTTNAEPDMSNLIKVIKDFVLMNRIDKEIEKELNTSIKYFASRISDNEQGARILYDRNYSYNLSLEKLAAYLNLNSGNKVEINNPEIDVKGNRALLEISLYNAFLVSIIKITSYWKNKIFNNYNKVDGDNLPSDTKKKIADLVKSPAQYDYVFKAIHIVVGTIINNVLTNFVVNMKQYQDSKKPISKVSLTEPEMLALEELFVTRLNKKAPREYLKQWV